MSEETNIDALRQLMEKATAGPYHVRTLENFGFNIVHYVDGDKFVIMRVGKCGDEADAEMIVAAVNALPTLLTELEALRASRGRMVDMWTCFHCGDTFTDKQQARLHFGRDERSEAACVIKAGAEGSLLKALRDAEYQADDAIQRMHDESTDAAKAYHAQRCRHTQALIAAEELGYERGLADGRALQPAEDCGEVSRS